ncbi:MAG: nucleotidyltransferase family protein [Flavobacteriia bacterium]|nr:nucleotidyltransferase family protein [Flavobacteriia bacterium]
MKHNVLILAGGLSSRMGFPKPFLLFNENQSFLDKIVMTYSNLSTISEIIVVLNSSFYSMFKSEIEYLTEFCCFIPNDYPEKDRMYSIRLGLNAFHKNNPTFIQNVDNPFIDLETLNALTQNKLNGFEYTSPVFNNKSVHPVLLSEQIVTNLQNDINEGSLNEKLKMWKKKLIPVKNELLSLDFNEFTEYEKYFKHCLTTVMSI